MKKLFLVLAVFTALLSMQSCHQIKTNAGEEKVLVSRPIFGGGEIKDTPVDPGKRVWKSWTTKGHRYSMLPAKATESFDNIMTKDNNPVSLNAHVIIELESGKSPIIHSDFGRSWYTANVQEKFRSRVRSIVSSYDMHALTTQRHIVDSLQEIVKVDLQTYAKSISLPVKINKVIIGKVEPPEAVLAQTIATAAQKQASRTYIAQTKAEGDRAVSENARAIADQAYANKMNMTTTQFLRSVELANQRFAIEEKADVSFIYGIDATYVKN